MVREDCLCFRATPRQVRGMVKATVVMAAVTAGAGALAWRRFGFNSVFGAWDLAAAVGFLLALGLSVTLPFAYTELSPSGIRARGYVRLRTFLWTEVAAIELENVRGSRSITVVRRNRPRWRRSRFRLAVPSDRGMFASDAGFAGKFSDISRYWQEATARLP